MPSFPAGKVWLYLIDFSEPRDNALRIVVAEAKPEGRYQSPKGTVSDVRPIVISASSRHFELKWDRYVAYSVRNESFARFDKDRLDTSETFAERNASAFLRYIAETTFASPAYPGPLRHWELTCLNHCLDIVAIEAPEIRELAK